MSTIRFDVASAKTGCVSSHQRNLAKARRFRQRGHLATAAKYLAYAARNRETLVDLHRPAEPPPGEDLSFFQNLYRR